MKRRLIGLVLSGLLHAAIILAGVALVRFTAEPILFVDLAHGLDLAEEAVSDLRRAVADVRSRVSARGDHGSRSKRAPAPSAPSSPAAPEPAPPRAAEPALPASPPPEPVRAAPEPPRPAEPPRAVTEATPAPPSRTVEVTPSASAAGESAAVSAPTTAGAAGGGDNAGRASSGSGADGGSLSDAGSGPAGSGARSGARDGGALALAVPGSGGGDPAAADYAGYYDSLRRRLYESLTYPAVARRRSLTGTVIVDVEIDASGKVGRVTVVDSSSHAMLDEAALDALRAVSRVPFPPGVPPRRLRVRLPVVFEIR
jgi:periplasmic protein TonB